MKETSHDAYEKQECYIPIPCSSLCNTTVNQFTLLHKPEITPFDCNCSYFLLIYCMHSECEGPKYMHFKIKGTKFLFEKGTKNVYT